MRLSGGVGGIGHALERECSCYVLWPAAAAAAVCEQDKILEEDEGEGAQ
jgi:hypothetical protein